MILLIAVVIGLTAGLIRAWIRKREYRFYELRYPILVFIAFIPQLFAFFLPSTRESISNQFASVLLVSSLLLLLVFSFLNIKKSCFWPIIAGFFANFLVIIMNGGFMPISPETVERIYPNEPYSSFLVGQRLGTGKDVILNKNETLLSFLSDRIVPPDWLNFPVAFSFGDILISIGVIWLFWSMGGPMTQKVEEPNE